MNAPLPNLTFVRIKYGNRESSWSFNSLYYTGFSALSIRDASRSLSYKTPPAPDSLRVKLCLRLYENLQGEITAGKSPATIKATYQATRSFFAWADENSKSLSLSAIEQVFVDWCDWHFDKTRGNPSAAQTAFTKAARVGSLIDSALDRQRTLISLSRLRKRGHTKAWVRNSEKIAFDNLFSMGEALIDVCNSLTTERTQGKLPIIINFRTGKTLEHWCGLIPTESLKWGGRISEGGRYLNNRVKRMEDASWNSRHSIMNVRIEAEILIFIAQTQMNLTQVLELRYSKVSYQSTGNGYRVANIYKARRGGEVSFNIYSEYRQHFEKYLKWRDVIFPGDDLLFPLRSHNTRTLGNCPRLSGIRKILTKIKIEYFPPRALRLAKVNWLLRKTRDPSLTAEMAQHAETTLLQSYERPNHQAALAEMTRYHQAQEAALAPPGPGMCILPEPLMIISASKGSPKPDCANPAGCMFCQHQRDIAELDHVWSLYSYRYLKSIELATHRPSAEPLGEHPAKLVVDIITRKLQTFSEIEVFKPWINESELRVEEKRFHPKWDGFIRLMEYRL